MDIYSEGYYLNLPVASRRIASLVRHLELSSGDSVCEIGCAAGHFLAAIARRIKYGVGIDTAAAAIQAALSLKESQGLDNIHFQRISAEEYAVSTGLAGRFNYVFLMDVTEHIEDETLLGVLGAARTLLAEDGELIIHTPNLDYWLEQLKNRRVLPQLEGHIAVRNFYQYVSLLGKAGYEVRSSKHLPHYRQPLRLLDTLLMQSPLIGKLFVSRLFIAARQPVLARKSANE